jgi:hypothetical protein
MDPFETPAQAIPEQDQTAAPDNLDNLRNIWENITPESSYNTMMESDAPVYREDQELIDTLTGKIATPPSWTRDQAAEQEGKIPLMPRQKHDYETENVLRALRKEHPDVPFQEMQKADPGFLEKAANTARLAGQALTEIPGAAWEQTKEVWGGKPNVVEPSPREQQMLKDRVAKQRYLESIKDNAVLFGLDAKDIAEMPDQIASTVVAGGHALAAGAAALLLSPDKIVSTPIAIASSFTAMYKMDKNQIMREYLMQRNYEQLAKTGKPLTLDQQEYWRKQFDIAATHHGVWEALGETPGAVFGAMKLLPKFQKVIGGTASKISAKELAKDVLQFHAFEAGGEAMTQMGQQQIEYAHGLTEPGEKYREWSDPAAWQKSFAEIYPATVMTSLFFAGLSALGGGAGMLLAPVAGGGKRQRTKAGIDKYYTGREYGGVYSPEETAAAQDLEERMTALREGGVSPEAKKSEADAEYAAALKSLYGDLSTTYTAAGDPNFLDRQITFMADHGMLKKSEAKKMIADFRKENTPDQQQKMDMYTEPDAEILDLLRGKTPPQQVAALEQFIAQTLPDRLKGLTGKELEAAQKQATIEHAKAQKALSKLRSAGEPAGIMSYSPTIDAVTGQQIRTENPVVEAYDSAPQAKFPGFGGNYPGEKEIKPTGPPTTKETETLPGLTGMEPEIPGRPSRISSQDQIARAKFMAELYRARASRKDRKAKQATTTVTPEDLTRWQQLSARGEEQAQNIIAKREYPERTVNRPTIETLESGDILVKDGKEYIVEYVSREGEFVILRDRSANEQVNKFSDDFYEAKNKLKPASEATIDHLMDLLLRRLPDGTFVQPKADTSAKIAELINLYITNKKNKIPKKSIGKDVVKVTADFINEERHNKLSDKKSMGMVENLKPFPDEVQASALDYYEFKQGEKTLAPSMPKGVQTGPKWEIFNMEKLLMGKKKAYESPKEVLDAIEAALDRGADISPIINYLGVDFQGRLTDMLHQQFYPGTTYTEQSREEKQHSIWDKIDTATIVPTTPGVSSGIIRYLAGKIARMRVGITKGMYSGNYETTEFKGDEIKDAMADMGEDFKSKNLNPKAIAEIVNKYNKRTNKVAGTFYTMESEQIDPESLPKSLEEFMTGLGFEDPKWIAEVKAYINKEPAAETGKAAGKRLAAKLGDVSGMTVEELGQAIERSPQKTELDAQDIYDLWHDYMDERRNLRYYYVAKHVPIVQEDTVEPMDSDEIRKVLAADEQVKALTDAQFSSAYKEAEKIANTITEPFEDKGIYEGHRGKELIELAFRHDEKATRQLIQDFVNYLFQPGVYEKDFPKYILKNEGFMDVVDSLRTKATDPNEFTAKGLAGAKQGNSQKVMIGYRGQKGIWRLLVDNPEFKLRLDNIVSEVTKQSAERAEKQAQVAQEVEAAKAKVSVQAQQEKVVAKEKKRKVVESKRVETVAAKKEVRAKAQAKEVSKAKLHGSIVKFLQTVDTKNLREHSETIGGFRVAIEKNVAGELSTLTVEDSSGNIVYKNKKANPLAMEKLAKEMAAVMSLQEAPAKVASKETKPVVPAKSSKPGLTIEQWKAMSEKEREAYGKAEKKVEPVTEEPKKEVKSHGKVQGRKEEGEGKVVPPVTKAAPNKVAALNRVIESLSKQIDTLKQKLSATKSQKEKDTIIKQIDNLTKAKALSQDELEDLTATKPPPPPAPKVVKPAAPAAKVAPEFVPNAFARNAAPNAPWKVAKSGLQASGASDYMAVMTQKGIPARLSRQGDTFTVETLDKETLAKRWTNLKLDNISIPVRRVDKALEAIFMKPNAEYRIVGGLDLGNGKTATLYKSQRNKDITLIRLGNQFYWMYDTSRKSELDTIHKKQVVDLSFLRSRVHPSAKVETISANEFRVTYPNYSFMVRLNEGMPQVKVSTPEGDYMASEFGHYEYRTVTGASLIRLAKLGRGAAESTLDHELFHMFSYIFLTRSEQQMLYNYYNAQGMTFEETWESICEAYADWKIGQSVINDNFFLKMMRGIRDFLYKNFGLFSDQYNSRMTPEGLFRAIESGKITTRVPLFNHPKNMLTDEQQKRLWGRVQPITVNGNVVNPHEYAQFSFRNEIPETSARSIFTAINEPGMEKNFPFTAKIFNNIFSKVRPDAAAAAELDITDQDAKFLEYTGSLLHWMAQRGKEWGIVKAIEKAREQLNNKVQHEYWRDAQAYKGLKKEVKANINAVLIQGDFENKRFTEDELRKGIAITRPFHPMQGQRIVLDEAQIKGYNSMRDYLSNILERMFDFQERSLFRPDLYEAIVTPSEFSMLKDYHRELITGGHKYVITDTHKYANEKEGNKYRHLKFRAAVRKIDERFNEVRAKRAEFLGMKNNEGKYINAGYVPHSFQRGKYFLAIKRKFKDANGKDQEEYVYSYNADNANEILAERNRLQALPEFQDTAESTFVFKADRSSTPEESSLSLIGDLNVQNIITMAVKDIASDNKLPENIADKMIDAIAGATINILRARGAGRHQIKRKQTAWDVSPQISGFEMDNLEDVLDSYVTGFNGMMTKFDASIKYVKLLKDLPDNKPKLKAQISEFMSYRMRNADKWDKHIGKARGLAFHYFLAGKISSAVMQMTQNFVTGIPWLGAEMRKFDKDRVSRGLPPVFNMFSAEKYYTKAMLDIAANGRSAMASDALAFNRNTKITEDERAMLIRKMEDGELLAQFSKTVEIQAKGAWGKTFAKIAQYTTFPFQGMETFNRRAAALAYYRMCKDAGITDQDRVDKLIDNYIDSTHYWMGKANESSFAQAPTTLGRLSRLALTFRRFMHNYVLGLIHAYSMYGTAGGLLLTMRSFAYLALFGGLFALPFLDDLTAGLEQVTGYPARMMMRKRIRTVLGNKSEQLAFGGLPAIFGESGLPFAQNINIRGAITTGLPLVGTDATQAFLGVYAGLGKKAIDATHYISIGDYEKAAMSALPTSLENAIKAHILNTRGETTSNEMIVTDPRTGKPLKLSNMEAFYQGFGFRSYDHDRIKADIRSADVTTQWDRAKRNKLANEIRYASEQKDTEKLIRLSKKMTEYYQASTDRGLPARPITNIRTEQQRTKAEQLLLDRFSR